MLKAGKFYVPLDPAYPAARLRYMLEDSQAPAIITSSAVLELARQLAPPECRPISIDTLDSGGVDEDPPSSVSCTWAEGIAQVKVRGHRVELAEIEMALLGLPGIKDAVVIQRHDARGGPRLVAYLVPAGEPAPTVSALRSALARALPDHMVPSAFVTVNALPLTPAGKVDRRALPAPGRVRPELDGPFVAPRTPVERGVTDIWADVLALDQVGIHDHFLDLGGDSLLATQIIARVIQTFRVELPVRALFDSPTVALMALVIVAEPGRAGQSRRASSGCWRSWRRSRTGRRGEPGAPKPILRRALSVRLPTARRAYFTLPRISPGGNAVVWTLT